MSRNKPVSKKREAVVTAVDALAKAMVAAGVNPDTIVRELMEAYVEEAEVMGDKLKEANGKAQQVLDILVQSRLDFEAKNPPKPRGAPKLVPLAEVIHRRPLRGPTGPNS